MRLQPPIVPYFRISEGVALVQHNRPRAIIAGQAMGNFTGWTYATVNAIASEVANIKFASIRSAETTKKNLLTTRC